MAQTNHGALQEDGVFVRNLKRATFKRSVLPLPERVVSMTTVNEFVVLGTASYGCLVCRVGGDRLDCIARLGEQPTEEHRGQTVRLVGGSTCTEVSASPKSLVFIKECEGSISVCVHNFADVLGGDCKPIKSHPLQQRAPMVVDHDLGLLVIGGAAWKTSWTTDSGTAEPTGDDDQCNVRVLGFNFELRRDMVVAENCVSILRLQVTPQHSMLGAADTRTGLKVFDLRHPTVDGYKCLYHLPVEEIRNFQLVGTFVAVFHRFEPNVTFWNMKEQRTILCINIQDQIKQLAEEFSEEDEDETGLIEDEDDHVASVTSVRFGSDYMLVYGTRSGCLFGMSVTSRMKVFNIPYPLESADQQAVRRSVLGVGYVAEGKLVASFEGVGLSVLDFGLEDPPDRPPTRGQMK